MAVRASRVVQPILTGVPECDAMLKAVGLKVGNRAARSVLAKGVRLAVKRIKAQVPSAQKSVRASIGGSVKKQKRGSDRGVTKAKAGAAVAKKNTPPKGGSNGGVGIGPANVHWYVLGTKERTVKSTGQRAGSMPAHPIVKDAMASGGGEIVGMMKREMRPAIERETNKEARRLLKKRSR